MSAILRGIGYLVLFLFLLQVVAAVIVTIAL